jgi:hypothetical protein
MGLLNQRTPDAIRCHCAGACVEPYPEAASDSTSGLLNDQNHVRRSFLDAERGWLFLALSYEFAERLSRFTEPFRLRQVRQK